VRTALLTLSTSVTNTSLLMFYKAKVAVCSEIRTKHINAVCVQNVEFFSVKPGGTRSNHWALRD
jgi:hypothetical protein